MVVYRKYADLGVYQKAYVLALKLHKACEPFPKTEQYGGMADQMRRASKSICANIAEGFGKGSTPTEEKRFLSMAMGSAQELMVWLDFSRDLTYIKPAQVDEFQLGYIEIGKMLRGLMSKRM